MQAARIVLFLFVLIPSISISTPAAASNLTDAVLAAARAEGLSDESIAFALSIGGRNEGHRAEAAMAPASCQKLLVASAALDLLGPKALLSTDLFASGDLRGDTLAGNLIAVGGGDPGISARFSDGDPAGELRQWVAALRALGVRRVTGHLLGDDSYLQGDCRRAEWPEEQLHRWYCAPSGALNLNDNCFDVAIEPVRRGAETRISIAILPANAFARIDGSIQPVADRKKHLYSLDRTGDDWTIRAAGKFYAKGEKRTEWVTVPDPTLAFLGALRELLRVSDISIDGDCLRGTLPAGAEKIARTSHAIETLLPVLLKHSQNLYGDCLLRVLGRRTGGDGSYESGGAAVERYATSIHAGPFTIRDGSGLSSSNRLSAALLVAILDHAGRQPWSSLFWDSLPIAGVDGTLRNRFDDSPLRGRVVAKTGSAKGTSSLAGKLPTTRGELHFAFIFNGRDGEIAKAKRWQQRALEALDRALSL